MPVTARLSRAFYDKLGDDVANELVNWLNEVDLTYRTELRQLNDLNFARFDAKVGERLAELRTQLRAELHAELDARFAELEGRFAKIDDRFAKVDDRFTRLEEQLRDLKISTIRWMFTFWVGTGVVVLGWVVARWLTA
jgi:predicted nuclease with TOPRIM domain